MTQGSPNQPPLKESNTLEWFAILLSVGSVLAAWNSATSSKMSSQTARDALAVSEKRYDLSVEQFATEKDRFKRDESRRVRTDREEQKATVFLKLEQTENRYRLISPTSLGIANSNDDTKSRKDVELEIQVVQEGNRFVPRFRLPRAHELVYQQSTLPNGTRLPVETAKRQLPFPINVQNVSPFECIDCTNNLRLTLFVEAKKIRPSSSELTPRELVSLARAANDFGDQDVAIKSLEKALGKVDNEDLPIAYRSDTLGEIGKTLLLMGQAKGGYSALEASRKLWKSQEYSYRINPVYDSLLWEIQFASRSNDRKRVDRRLSELAENVASLKVSVSRKSDLIHGAHASCIAILSEFAEYDPSLKVPREYFLRDSTGQWTTAYEIIRGATPSEPLPAPMVWAR